jgi:DNA-binding MarR family transcriptional regulator
MKRQAPQHRADETLGYLVLDVARLMSARFDSRARELGVTRAQWTLIAALLRVEGATQAHVAELMQVTPMAVGRLVDRMSRAGWIERRREAGDRRAHRLYLTAKAHAIRPALRQLSAETEAEALDGLDTAAREQLLARLAVVRQTLASLPPRERRRGP